MYALVKDCGRTQNTSFWRLFTFLNSKLRKQMRINLNAVLVPHFVNAKTFLEYVALAPVFDDVFLPLTGDKVDDKMFHALNALRYNKSRFERVIRTKLI